MLGVWNNLLRAAGVIVALSQISHVVACGEEEINAVVKSTVSGGLAHIDIDLPVQTETLYHPTAIFYIDKLQVPMHEGYEEDNRVYYTVSGPFDSIKQARIDIHYHYKPQDSEDGQSRSVTLCLHETSITWADGLEDERNDA